MNTADHDKRWTACKKKDNETALKEFKYLAKAGNAVGQHGLGRIYFDGWGVSQNYKTAVKWYKLAAEQGMPMHNATWVICTEWVKAFA